MPQLAQQNPPCAAAGDIDKSFPPNVKVRDTSGATWTEHERRAAHVRLRAATWTKIDQPLIAQQAGSR
jgi:hypothetical protein